MGNDGRVAEEKRITPLFQVNYDRTLCKPLRNTLVETSDVTDHRTSPTRYMSASRSPSPITTDLTPETQTPTVPSSSKTEKRTKSSNARDNALTIFEFSTVFPFVYGRNSLKCFVCTETLKEGYFLSSHMKENHNFQSLKRLLTKNRSENIIKVDVSLMSCKLCSLTLNSFNELKVHLQQHGKPIEPDLKDYLVPFKLTNEGNTHKCVLCHREFLKFRLLVIHLNEHFSNYSCEVCGNGYINMQSLKNHLLSHENKSFPCKKCGKEFNSKHNRNVHDRGVHLKQNTRTCPFCPERFSTTHNRTKHLETVHNQTMKVYKCEICGKLFDLKCHMQKHIRLVHLQEKNYQCEVCHQRFSKKELLKKHLLKHSGHTHLI